MTIFRCGFLCGYKVVESSISRVSVEPFHLRPLVAVCPPYSPGKQMQHALYLHVFRICFSFLRPLPSNNSTNHQVFLFFCLLLLCLVGCICVRSYMAELDIFNGLNLSFSFKLWLSFSRKHADLWEHKFVLPHKTSLKLLIGKIVLLSTKNIIKESFFLCDKNVCN